MIHAGLQASGLTSYLAGNIGGSFLPNLHTIEPDDFIVLELSSAMLWWLDRNGSWSPHVGVLTTVEENHLDWHGSFEEYSRCKRLIFAHQTDQDFALTQDPNATFSGLSVIGQHNQRNAAVAFLAVNAIGVDSKKAREGIQSFTGLPHRLQKVGEYFYNDSKSTTPMATKLAIDAFPDSTKVHLIVGGYDKQIDLTLLANQSERVNAMYAIGETGEKIISLSNYPIQNCESLDCAVNQAMQSMSDGDVLLLSPGCASWDQFENYEHRGERFCELILNEVVRQQGH
jgi:UDP-N-acetylmuramoylalanine--D-glutamate ligase